jgi:hypothetical protein
MNEQILFNISTPDILANATAIQIDSSPMYTLELILWLLLTIQLLWFFLWLWFKFRRYS